MGISFNQERIAQYFSILTSVRLYSNPTNPKVKRVINFTLYNNNMAQTVTSSKREMTPEEIADNVKKTAKNVRDAAIRVRMVVKALQETGAMNDVAEAVREAAITSHYTAKQISVTAKEIERTGVVKEVGNAATKIKESAKSTVQLAKSVAASATA